MVDSLNNDVLMTLETSDGHGQSDRPLPVILIVDDDEDSRLMLKLLLEIWNYKVIEARDGYEAIWVAEQFSPDLIVMDVKLPDLDGFDVTLQIRQSVNIRNVPIVFLSACAESVFKQKAAAGGNDYLVKPLNFEVLEYTLDKYIKFSPEILV